MSNAISYRKADVGGINFLYREGGEKHAETVTGTTLRMDGGEVRSI